MKTSFFCLVVAATEDAVLLRYKSPLGRSRQSWFPRRRITDGYNIFAGDQCDVEIEDRILEVKGWLEPKVRFAPGQTRHVVQKWDPSANHGFGKWTDVDGTVRPTSAECQDLMKTMLSDEPEQKLQVSAFWLDEEEYTGAKR